MGGSTRVSHYFYNAVVAKDECEQLISEYKDSDFTTAQVSGNPKIENDKLQSNVRETDIIWIKPEKLINRSFYSFVSEANNKVFHFDLSGHQQIQFSKYTKDGYYEWHRDSLNANPKEGASIRKLSATIQLSDPSTYEGGEFQFYDGVQSEIIPDIKEQGSIIIFESADWHRITPITQGVRYSLVMWAIGPNFR